MTKPKLNKWKIEIEVIDKGDPLLSNILTNKRDRYYITKRDIKNDLNYFFRKMNPYYKIKNIRKII